MFASSDGPSADWCTHTTVALASFLFGRRLQCLNMRQCLVCCSSSKTSLAMGSLTFLLLLGLNQQLDNIAGASAGTNCANTTTSLSSHVADHVINDNTRLMASWVVIWCVVNIVLLFALIKPLNTWLIFGNTVLTPEQVKTEKIKETRSQIFQTSVTIGFESRKSGRIKQK